MCWCVYPANSHQIVQNYIVSTKLILNYFIFLPWYRNFLGAMEIIPFFTILTWMHCQMAMKSMMVIIKVRFRHVNKMNTLQSMYSKIRGGLQILVSDITHYPFLYTSVYFAAVTTRQQIQPQFLKSKCVIQPGSRLWI